MTSFDLKIVTDAPELQPHEKTSHARRFARGHRRLRRRLAARQGSEGEWRPEEKGDEEDDHKRRCEEVGGEGVRSCSFDDNRAGDGRSTGVATRRAGQIV